MSSKLRTTEPSDSQSGNDELGDLSFDDWYETPVFEVEPDERLEQLATSRRAPLRLFAGAVLRVAPSRPRKERRRGAEARLSMEALDSSPAPVAAEAEVLEPAVVESAVVEPAAVDSPAGTPSPSVGSWRDRTGRFLDRWAALETASQDRLEALVLPKRWRG